MSLPDALRSFAGALEGAGHALAALSAMTKTTTDDKAADVLKVIGAGLEAVIADLGIKIDPDEVLRHIEALRTKLAGNDAATDKAIADKFDKG